MKSRVMFLLFLAVFIVMGVGGSLTPVLAQANREMIYIDAQNAGDLNKLQSMGLDIAAIRKISDEKGGVTYRVELVVKGRDKQKLLQKGFQWQALAFNKAPEAMKRLGMVSAVTGVYHSFDEPELGIKAQLYKIAQTYPHITRLKTIGYSHQGRPMLALRLSGSRPKDKRCKPEVLYLATHHAREWIATQVGMRLIQYFTANYGSDDRVTRILDSTDIWVIPVANPDGYEYTFTTDRLWRKNLRDNDGDGVITDKDGVDLNRNFPSHWGLDDEGSSPDPMDETYRGPVANSEPETRAVVNFIKQHHFEFLLSYHSYSDLILYAWGWQVKTASLDDPINVALAGTDENPAIRDSLLNRGYDPGVGADLYITNGDFTDWAYDARKIPSFVVELTDEYGFEFPDDEQMVQSVFTDNLPFALALAESAADPEKPVSPVGITTQSLYHSAPPVSYGADQIIDVLALKRLHPKLYYSINGGPKRLAHFREHYGLYYNDEPGAHYTSLRAVIPHQKAGDTVAYTIKAGKEQFGPFTYNVANVSKHRILVVSAEDYTGSRPPYPDPSRPNYLDKYTAALDAAGYGYDVWDVTAKGAVPDAAGVLSHYDVAVWYSGDDYANELIMPRYRAYEALYLNFRTLINNGGRLLATGQDLSFLSYFYIYSDDFFQYYLGSSLHLETAGFNGATGLPYDVMGLSGDPVFNGLAFKIHGGDGAGNQANPDAFVPTSHFLPSFKDRLAARYDRQNIFNPITGQYWVASQKGDEHYKRLGGTFTISGVSPTLSFWMYFSTEADWDYAFVEIAEAGTDNWTTLADMNGLTSQNTGESCAADWVNGLHPFLAHYMDADCNPTGSTGSWNAFNGNSGGWQKPVFDLSAYAGKTVEIYISYATDWGTQGMGIFVDDIDLTGYAVESFESGYGYWNPNPPPPGTPTPNNNWLRGPGLNYPDGPALRTPYSVYLGFGFEAVDTAQNRKVLMDRIMRYLLSHHSDHRRPYHH